MKKLSNETYRKVNFYMNKEARGLEKALFNYFFNDSPRDVVLNMLEEYQNSDGGFGKGIEPDFRLIDSSPMGTSIGLRYLNLLEQNDRAQKMIIKAIEYLESTYDNKRNGWYSVPATVNDYPHAPHWTYRRDIEMTLIDYSWGNPTAELIGYLYKYRKYLRKIDVFSLLNYAIENLNKQTEFISEHNIFCYIKMYNIIDKQYSSKIEDTIGLAISQLININEEEWTGYVPTPLKFIDFDSRNFFGIENKHIDNNLDYLVNNLEKDGRIFPTWEWDDYLNEWENARKEWIGDLTLNAMLSLKKFNRIENN